MGSEKVRKIYSTFAHDVLAPLWRSTWQCGVMASQGKQLRHVLPLGGGLSPQGR